MWTFLTKICLKHSFRTFRSIMRSSLNRASINYMATSIHSQTASLDHSKPTLRRSQPMASSSGHHPRQQPRFCRPEWTMEDDYFVWISGLSTATQSKPCTLYKWTRRCLTDSLWLRLSLNCTSGVPTISSESNMATSRIPHLEPGTANSTTLFRPLP